MNKREGQQLEELRRRMAESFDQWYAENRETLDPPPLDLSFMEQNPEIPDEQKNAGNERFHWFNMRGLRNAAAVFLVVIVLSSVVTVWMNSNVAHALKFRIEKMFYETSNHYYSTGESGNRDDNMISIKVTDLKDFDIIQRRIPDLLLPERLLEGYYFSQAEAKYWENQNWICSISYNSQDDSIINIVEANNRRESELKSNIMAEEILTANGRTVYYVQENDQIRGLFFIVNNVFVQISGDIEKEELLRMESFMR